MNNPTQLERYKKLLHYIDLHFKEDLNIERIEAISHYSYRNINRIFEALHHETIGKYIKRLRLEKAAQYLKYATIGVADIAHEVGFADRVAFSKAFKKKYGCSPSTFRSSSEAILATQRQTLLNEVGPSRPKLQFEVAHLPDFEYLFLEHRGDYEDVSAIEATSQQLYDYVEDKGILNDRSIFMTEMMDDNEISDRIHLRYNVGFILERPLPFAPEGLYRTKTHRAQKYAKFFHEGTPQSYFDFYKTLYAFWMLDVSLELADLPTLEFYPDYERTRLPAEMRTEIYIPVA
ncbi:MAG: AraC family transcriptional regulator [Bacteroidota bacterium]